MSKADLTDVYEDPYRDRILFVTSDFEKAGPFFQVLISKGYCTKLIDLLQPGNKELISYDLVCIYLMTSELTDETFSILRNSFLAPTVPCIIICDSQPPNLIEELLPSTMILPSTAKASELLVKVSLQLRLRKERFETVSEQVSIVSENASLRALTNQFSRELEEAKDIHNRLLPRTLPTLRSASLGAIYLPLEAVGGDLYDVWEIDDEHVGLFIADVTGHGLPAAFIGAMIKMLLRIEVQTSSSRQLSFIDGFLSKYLPESRFATAISIVYNQKTHEINVSRAGHTPLLIYRKESDTVETVEPKGPPLTLGDLIPFEEVKTSLSRGDQLLLYTDGITEVMNMSGELMGVEMLAKEFSRLAKIHGISEVLRHLHEYQEQYSDGRLAKDDLTILGLEQK